MTLMKDDGRAVMDMRSAPSPEKRPISTDLACERWKCRREVQQEHTGSAKHDFDVACFACRRPE